MILQIDGHHAVTDADLSALAATQTHLSAICLSDLPQITDHSVKLLIQANANHLTFLSVANCPNVSKEVADQIQTKILRYKQIS